MNRAPTPTPTPSLPQDLQSDSQSALHVVGGITAGVVLAVLLLILVGITAVGVVAFCLRKKTSSTGVDQKGKDGLKSAVFVGMCTFYILCLEYIY